MREPDAAVAWRLFQLNWLLIAVASALFGLGLLLMLPVVVARPRFRNVYMGWGVSLYLLGVALASQVAAAVG